MKQAIFLADFWKKLSQKGLAAFYSEVNPISEDNTCSEYSFLNTKRNPVLLLIP